MSQTRLDLDDEDAAVVFDDDTVYPEGGEYDLHFQRHHAFVPPDRKRVKGGQYPCQVCKRPDWWLEHHGFPERLENDYGDDPFAWNDRKKMWQLPFGEALHASGMPRASVYRGKTLITPGVETVHVVMYYTFGDRQRRDRDNLVYRSNKYFADAMVRGRYIEFAWDDIFDEGGHNITDWKVVNRPKPPSGKKPGQAVIVADPMGGFIPDDRWDRFEVIETLCGYEKDVYALDIKIYPSFVPPPPWPPARNAT